MIEPISMVQAAARLSSAKQARAEAKAAAAERATAAAEAKLAGQAMTGRGYMERMALLKSQLRDLQQQLNTQVVVMTTCSAVNLAH